MPNNQSRQMQTKLVMNATLAAIRSAPIISHYSTIKSVDTIEAMHNRHGQDRQPYTRWVYRRNVAAHTRYFVVFPEPLYCQKYIP